MSETLTQTFHFLRQNYWRSPIYSYLLGGDIPQDLILTPIEPWRGDASRGRKVIKGIFPYGAQIIKLSPDIHRDSWLPDNATLLWREGILGLDWLCDLAAASGTPARRYARDVIFDFIHAFQNWHMEAWRPDILGQRVSNILISLSGALCQCA